MEFAFWKFFWLLIFIISTIPENFIKMESKRGEKSIIFRNYRSYFGSKNSNLAPKKLKKFLVIDFNNNNIILYIIIFDNNNFKSIGLKDDEIWIFLWKTHFLSFRVIYGTSEAEIFRKSIFFMSKLWSKFEPNRVKLNFFYKQQNQSEERGRKGCPPPKTWCSRGFSQSARPKEENEPN